MNTLQERKNRIIETIHQHEEWMDDFEEMVDLIAKKRKGEQQETAKSPQKNAEDETWRKYAEPIKEKTDLKEIIANQTYDYEAFIKGCRENKFFQDMSDDDFFNMIEELS